MRKANLWMPAALVAVFLVLVFSYEHLGTYVPSGRIPTDSEKDFALMAEAWNTIEKFYVDRPAVKNRELTYGAISGMVDSLGDTGHSVFLTPEMIKEQNSFTQGRYKGVGIEVMMKKGHVFIVAALDGSPAQKAGLRSGEFITMVDGRVVSGLPLMQIVKLILGPEGTRVRLTILDPATGSTRTVTLTRAAISVRNVRWARLPGTAIAHLRIAGFSEGVTDDLRHALKAIRSQGIKGIILDLRDDPGGVLDEAVDCTSQFLKKGNVLLVKDAAGKTSPVPVNPGGEGTGIPLVVIVNNGTASGAEIMAGAIKDAGRAELVGEKTFGTGTVLAQFNLSDGSALMLAVEEWLTPDGHTIWHKGITPDIKVSLAQGILPLFPDEENDLTAPVLKSSGDAQLMRALKLVSAIAR